MTPSNDRTGESSFQEGPAAPLSNRLPSPFIIRRLFSLSGFLIGIFFILHLLSMAQVLGPRGTHGFERGVREFHDGPFFVLLEIFLLGLPYLFHVLIGMTLLHQSESNVLHYPKGSNLRYMLQRLTGVLGLAFVALHAYELRILPELVRMTVDYNYLVGFLQPAWRFATYFLGGVALLYYVTNGLWITLVRWGVTANRSAQRWSLIVCMMVFALLSILHGLILVHFRYQHHPAPMAVGWVLDVVRGYLFR